MSRLRRAVVAASFSYLQFLLAIATGIILVPMVVHYVGARSYGLWLTGIELLGYAAMADLGVIGVLPWLLAEADGRQDRGAMRSLIVNGVTLGAVVGTGYLLVSLSLWGAVASLLGLTADERAAFAIPLAILVGAGAISYPLRVFSAVISGLQDVTFNGILTVAQAALGVAITVVMLMKGYGLYALAFAYAVTSLVVGVAACARTAVIAPDLLRHWPRPTPAAARSMLTHGTGVWFSAFGWQLMAASNSLVMTSIGHPEWVTIYACTGKLASMATQLTWVMPDAGLVGLAQVHGEGRGPERLKPLVLVMLRLHLLLAGGAACGLLAFNPAFVTAWLGPHLFGGLPLNALLAVAVITASLIHGLLSVASVIGSRQKVGAIAIVNGVSQVACAFVLGRVWGLPGIAAAGLIAGLATSVPGAVRLLHPATSMTWQTIRRDLVGPWLQRSAPLLGIAALCGLLGRHFGMAAGLLSGGGCGLAYVWHMRPLYVDLPFDDRIGRWLVSLRLMPAPPPAGLERA